MTLADRIIAWAEAREPSFVIGRPGDPYLKRWFVIPRNRWLNVYVHEFWRSDDDRALHDHPWWNVSILLRGRYTEHTIQPGGVHVRTARQAGDIKVRPARSAHRIELTDGRCWTLFVTGPRLREWGFHCPNGWIDWRRFTAPTDKGQVGAGCDGASAPGPSRAELIAGEGRFR